ncbi:MAG: TolC family protein, partial [Fibrobacterales bacterium]
KNIDKNAPSIIRSQLESEKSYALKGKSRRLLLPTIKAEGEFEYTQQSIGNPTIEYQNYYGRLIIRQELINLSRFFDFRAASVGAAKSTLTVRQQKYDALLLYCYKWADLWKAQERYKTGRENEILRKGNLESARQRYSGGDLTKSDVSQIELEYIDAQSTTLGAYEALNSSRDKLFIDFGVVVDTNEIIDLPDVALTNESIQSTTQLTIAELSKNEAAQSEYAALSKHFPVLSVFASYERAWTENEPLKKRPYDDAVVGAVVSIPLFSSGAEYYGHIERTADRKIEEVNYAQLKREYEQSKVQNLFDINQNIKRLATAKKRHAIAQQNYTWIVEEYQSGNRSTVEVTIAQAAILRAAQELIFYIHRSFLGKIEQLYLNDLLTVEYLDAHLQTPETLSVDGP